ncbi:MAG: prolyl oligopeptidase family serine peptidase, partial [Bacteroidales bacterium]|nr:prolyl oligopeptidase family serine peptidase [Bacteroidales bacterium]
VLKKILVSKDPLAGYAKPETRVFTIKSADGVNDLYARMILPPDFDSTRQYPVIVYVYGGPHVQLITNSHLAGSPLTLQHFAQEGFIVFTVDSRGSAHRGFAFESAIHRNIGTVEVADQMKGVEYLYSLPYVDRDRIGVDGWSYGGFMTMSLKLRYPQVFKVAVAGGGVMNWAWYEVMYGERYMETPQSNPEGYEYANLLRLTDSVSGKILMIHGGKDATVLPKHSLYFIDACAQGNKSIDFFMYPNAAHGVYGPARKHLDRMIFEYFKNNL